MAPVQVQALPDGTLPLDCYISTSKIVVAQDGTFDNYGTWLDINDGYAYKLAKGSFDNYGVSHRRSEVVNPFLEGSYTVNALRDNAQSNLIVRVYGDTTIVVADRVRKLTTALDQVTFKLQVVIENAKYLYSCYASDYQIQTQQELLHARQALVQVTLSHDPDVTLSEVLA